MLPGLNAFVHSLEESARIVLAVRGTVEEARVLGDDADPTILVLAIGAHGVAEQFGVRVSPYLTVVDPDGRVRAKGLVNTADDIAHKFAEAGFRHTSVGRHVHADALVEVHP